MDRRRFLLTSLAGALAAPVAALGQQPVMPVIGFLSARSSGESASHVASFLRGLNETGYVEGRNVTIDYTVTPGCGGPVTCALSVTSNEPVNATGDGNTTSDWEITGDLTVNLRAERSGRGAGRIYTITVESVDRSGNVGRSTVTVAVAHNQ